MHSYTNNAKCQLTNIFILSLLSAPAAITIVVFAASSNNTGFIGQTSIIINTCTSTYYTDKYSNIRLINTLVFIASCLATLIAVHIVITVLLWFCKSSEHQKHIPKGQLFFFASCQVLASIPQFGYFLSFNHQLSNCSSASTYPIITTIIAGALLLLNLIKSISITCISEQSAEDVQKKYRFIYSQQTQHSEQVKPIKHNRKEVPKIIYMKSQPKEDYTKQAINVEDVNIQEISPKKAPSRFQTKDNEPHKFDQQHNYTIKHQSPSVRSKERPPVYMQQRITINLHPNFKQVDPSQYVHNQKQKNYQIDIIHNQFQEQQQKYLQSAYTNILPRGGLQQRERQPKNYLYNYPENTKKEDPIHQRPTDYKRNNQKPIVDNYNRGVYKSSYNNYEEQFPEEREKYYSPNKRSNRNITNNQINDHIDDERISYYNNRNTQENSFRIYDQNAQRRKPQFYR